MVMAGSYNYGLVALSIFIAMLGSYATINLAGRVKAAQGRTRLSWQIGGGVTMAIGTWAMHYTGMLAFHLPVPIQYDWPMSLLSFLLSFLASAVALVVVIRPKIKSFRALAASIFIGGGIVALHYNAMASMRLEAMHEYSPGLVTLSVFLAMCFSLLSIWLTFLFRDEPSGWKLRKVGSVALLGTAIWMMHYTGMASASFIKSDMAPDLSHAVSISTLGAVGIGAVAVMVLVVALVTTIVDRLHEQRALLDELFEQAPQAVALMSADNRVVRVNREFTRLFGYTPAEAGGRQIGELIVPDELRNEEQKYADAVSQGQRVDVEGIRRRKDSDRVDVSITRVPVSLPGGKIATYAIYNNIAERKRANDKIRETTEQLRALSARFQSIKEEEGTRIAREIHDELGSALTSLRWDLEEIDEAISDTADEPRLRTKIETMMRLIDTTVDTVKRIASELRPIGLDDLGLIEAIEWQARQFQERTGIVVEWDSAPEYVDLNREQSIAIFRIFQEALTNILRHAQASRVYIQMKEEAGEFILTIRDNGRGITEDEKSGTRTFGFLGMRERAHLLGGELDISGSDGKGTVVTVRISITG